MMVLALRTTVQCFHALVSEYLLQSYMWLENRDRCYGTELVWFS